MTVDEILASGWYTDKRGRSWRHLPLSGRWADQVIDHQGIHWAGQKIEADQMRLLIERDQHRGQCIGLSHCYDHPAASVVWGRKERQWIVFKPYGWANDDGIFFDHGAAMDAARALAVGE